MAQQNKPLAQNEMHGLYLAGNPAGRPGTTASKCENLRVMPGYWLRTFGGRKGRWNLLRLSDGAQETAQQIIPFRIQGLPGADNQIFQLKDGTGAVRWAEVSLATYTPNPLGESIATAYDGAFARSNPAAQAVLPNYPVIYNGLGVRGVSGSQPPFTMLYNGLIRYFGLDCYCPSGNPTVAFTAGAGYNTVMTSVDIWVGLYNAGTEHYSNAVKCGQITDTSGATGTITVSNLSLIKPSYHNSSEQNELFYVFYATIDGGAVPYLILDPATLSSPYKVSIVGSTTANLTLSSGTTNGWILDETAEAPQSNYPPRPMRALCYANGRLYGSPLTGGSGSAVAQVPVGGTYPRPDFTYQYSTLELPGVYWSAAYGESTATVQIGDALQSWPLINFAPTPNGDVPLALWPIGDDNNKVVLVLTPRASFLLTETADGLHTFSLISPLHGISKATTLADTPYGVCWVNQRNQMVMLTPDRQLVILSENYQDVIASAPICADYLIDSYNDIDSYRVYLADGTCIVHDFALKSAAMPYGEAYTATGQNYTAAKSVLDSSGRMHHIVANTAVYTQEAQPENGLIKTGVETFTSGQTVATSYASGTYMGNWTDYGDDDVRKEIKRVTLIGDGDNCSLSWLGNFTEVSVANENPAAGTIRQQDQFGTCRAYVFSPPACNGFWLKWILRWAPPASGIPTDHPNPQTQGDLAQNFYGCILRLAFRPTAAENRP